MLHEYAVSENIVDRYLRDELPTQDADAFEQHLLACGDCLDDFAASQRLREGLKGLVDAGELENPLLKPAASWWRSGSGSWAAAATVLLTVSLATSSVLFQKQRHLSSLVTSTAQVFPIVSVRSGADGAPVNVLTVSESTGMLVLMAETGDLQGAGQYSATLVGESGKTDPITFEPIALSSDGRLAIAIASSQLKPDDYRIEIREVGAKPVLNEVRFRLQFE